jgi:hypothetical protein
VNFKKENQPPINTPEGGGFRAPALTLLDDDALELARQASEEDDGPLVVNPTYATGQHATGQHATGQHASAGHDSDRVTADRLPAVTGFDASIFDTASGAQDTDDFASALELAESIATDEVASVPEEVRAQMVRSAPPEPETDPFLIANLADEEAARSPAATKPRTTERAPAHYESGVNPSASQASSPAGQRGASLRATTPELSSVPVAAVPKDRELRRAMSELFALGDFTGALELAEEILRSNPTDEGALKKSNACRETLMRMYYARLGPLDRVPMISVPHEQLRWMSIDQRAGFVLHHIDGMSSLDMIIDASGMPTLDVLRILTDLVTQRVITIG